RRRSRRGLSRSGEREHQRRDGEQAGWVHVAGESLIRKEGTRMSAAGATASPMPFRIGEGVRHAGGRKGAGREGLDRGGRARAPCARGALVRLSLKQPAQPVPGPKGGTLRHAAGRGSSACGGRSSARVSGVSFCSGSTGW